MYERLTERTENGGVKFSNGEYWNTVYPQNESCLTDIHRMAIRLCELEDKICEGKIVELPFSVGGRERLYYPVKGTNTILETKVFGIGVDEDGDVIFNPTEYPKKVIEMRGVEIGKTVFLDRAAAEAKLREMEGERE